MMNTPLFYMFLMIWRFHTAQEEVVNKTRSFDKMKSEAEKCLTQGERLCNEKIEFEDATYSKACLLLSFITFSNCFLFWDRQVFVEVERMLSCCSTDCSLCFCFVLSM